MSEQKYFPKTNRIIDDLKKLGVKETCELYSTKNLTKCLNETFLSEYVLYIEKAIFFPGCPLKIYQKNYQDNLNEYLSIYPDADEFQFLNEELERVKSLYWDWKKTYPFFNYLAVTPHRKNLNLSNEKVRDFIFKKNEALGNYIAPPFGIDEFEFFYSGRPVDYWLVELKRNEGASSTKEILKSTQVTKTSRRPKALTWINIIKNPQGLETLYSHLSEKGYVDCGLRSFKKIFEGGDVSEKVGWKGNSRILLYLYHLLLESKLIKGNVNRKSWINLAECFSYAPLDEKSNLSQIKYGDQNLPEKDFLDSLIKSILTDYSA